MRIAIVGTGYVGLVSAACFAELGHTVIGVDIDAAKVEKLKSGKSTIFEPGLEELIQRGLKKHLLSFTTDLVSTLDQVQIVFSAVATPPGEGYHADLRAVFTVAETVARHAPRSLLFVNKSTVPVGTGKQCQERMAKILAERGVDIRIPVISNPEFLREGMAVPDTLMPDRIVVGINGGTDHLVGDDLQPWHMMEELYRPITRVGKPLVFMSRESAEIVKYASNAFLATKISFINMLSELCDATGGSVRDVAKGMGLDGRIGPRFLHAGIGYGGSCFPKDVKALLATAKQYNLDFAIVEATDRINARQRKRFFDRILACVQPGQTVGVWGLSFKPKTDDMREAPSLDLLPLLIEHGCTVQAYDPEAMDVARTLIPSQVQLTTSGMEVVAGADALIVLTEWDEFRGADLLAVAEAMRGRDLFDGRNVYEPAEVRKAGLVYHGIGIR